MDDIRPRPVSKSTTRNIKKQGKFHIQVSFLKDKYFLSLILIILLIGGYFVRDYLGSPSRTIDTKNYQALFLTNGQVYFGKINKYTKDYVELDNVYYLQTQQSVQNTTSPNATAAGNTSGSTADNKTLLSLAKLGNELHGPKDSMFVATNQVLYWENLRENAKVVQAINDYQKSPH